MRPSSPLLILRLVLVAALYIAAGKLGLGMAFLHRSVSPVWPPTGIAIAAVLLLGREIWPAIAVGAFVVNVTTAGNAWTSLGIAAGNTLEAVVGAALVVRFANGRGAFDRTPDLFRFALFAGLLATLLSPTIGVTSLCLGREQQWDRFVPTWCTWWLGDVGGALVVAPPLILWGRRPAPGWSAAKTVEVLALLLCTVAVGELAFLGGLWPELSAKPLAFVCTPPLVWAAFRFGPRETGTTGALIAAIATWATLSGRGPYAALPPNAALLVLQAFLVVTMLTAMSLAAVVRERSRASELLAAKARDLERSNAELEQFASAASHDLQEPLRNILLQVKMLERDGGAALLPPASEYVRIARESGFRMQGLIRNLLKYARIGRLGGERRPIEASDVLRGVLADMRVAIEESRAILSVDPLPRVRADPHELGEVFQNLVGNAIKFRGEHRPEIEIGAENRGSDWVFCVRDHGIGIRPDDQERVFEVFQRLNSRERYPGEGIGLATCRRILERHCGRIWVESTPGEGSSFYFTLPAEPES